jgi:hypothetical protein
METPPGVNMTIKTNVYRSYHDLGDSPKHRTWALVLRLSGSGVLCWRWGRGDDSCLCIASGKEVDDTIDVRGVADVALFHIDVNQILKTIHLQGEGWAIGQMVDKGVHLGQVYGVYEQFFHSR